VSGASVALGVLAIAPPAQADPESEAKDLFQRGRQLREAGDCAGAMPIFRKVWKIYPQALGGIRNIAECEEQLGHFASSRRAWLDLKRALLTAHEDSKYDGWENDAEAAAKRLQPKVATVFVDVIVKSPQGEGPATESSGVELFVNGENLGPNLVGTPLERDPGAYKIRAQAPYAEAVSTEVALGAGDSRRVTIRIVQNPPAKPGEEVDTGGTKRTVGWALVGVGGASLVAGIVTMIVRSGAESDLDEKCKSHVNCDPSLRDTVDRGETMSVLTNVFLPVGGVALAAGVGLVIWGSQSKGAREKPANAAGLRVTPGLGRLDATWRF